MILYGKAPRDLRKDVRMEDIEEFEDEEEDENDGNYEVYDPDDWFYEGSGCVTAYWSCPNCCHNNEDGVCFDGAKNAEMLYDAGMGVECPICHNKFTLLLKKKYLRD